MYTTTNVIHVYEIIITKSKGYTCRPNSKVGYKSDKAQVDFLL